jgi:hypothetical protein
MTITSSGGVRPNTSSANAANAKFDLGTLHKVGVLLGIPGFPV